MSLRDDLELCFACIGKQVHTNEVIAIAEAMNRLRAALSPVAIKWLEALPELMELEARTPRTLPPACDLDYMLRSAIHEAAALHAAASAVNAGTDNKEQK